MTKLQGERGHRIPVMKKYAPLLGQIYVQVSYGAMFLIARVALTQGLSPYLFVFYRQAVATLAITPFAYFLESDQRSKLTLKNVGHISLLAFLGVTISQNFYYAGLSLTSTTLATAMNNINPALTFVMAVAFRMEKLNVWTRRGQAKVWGTLLCVGGAMIMTLFKGPAITLLNKSSAPIPTGSLSETFESPPLPDGRSWILGALLLAAGVWAWAACFIYQAWTVEECPAQLTTTTVMCWMGVPQTALVALLSEKPAAWLLKWDLQLLAVSYSGVFCSALGLFVQMWCVKERVPVFATVFSPLSTVLVAIIEPFVLHVPLGWGSLTGMVMVIGGLYCVLWGKAGEDEETAGKIKSSNVNVGCAADGAGEPLLTQSAGHQIQVQGGVLRS